MDWKADHYRLMQLKALIAQISELSPDEIEKQIPTLTLFAQEINAIAERALQELERPCPACAHDLQARSAGSTRASQ